MTFKHCDGPPPGQRIYSDQNQAEPDQFGSKTGGSVIKHGKGQRERSDRSHLSGLIQARSWGALHLYGDQVSTSGVLPLPRAAESFEERPPGPAAVNLT